MHEIFEHTADVRLAARADDVNELFAEAAQALFSVIVVNPADVRPVETVGVAVGGRQLDELMHDWLAELLYLFEARRLLFCRFHVRVGPEGLTADIQGEPIDSAKAQARHGSQGGHVARPEGRARGRPLAGRGDR